jgi:hypothetical protein
VGYLEELNGTKKFCFCWASIRLPRGKLAIRISCKKFLETGHEQTIRVTLTKDPRAQLPTVTVKVKLEVTLNGAAVFMDDSFPGPVHGFGGIGRALLINAGKHRIKIALPGYQTFETEICSLIRNLPPRPTRLRAVSPRLDLSLRSRPLLRLLSRADGVQKLPGKRPIPTSMCCAATGRRSRQRASFRRCGRSASNRFSATTNRAMMP